jgi:hypothetical protein
MLECALAVAGVARATCAADRLCGGDFAAATDFGECARDGGVALLALR